MARAHARSDAPIEGEGGKVVAVATAEEGEGERIAEVA